MNHVFTSHGWPGVCVLLTWGTHGTRMHYGKKAVMLWAMFCWETSGPAIHVDVTLTRTTCLSIVADHEQPSVSRMAAG